MTGVGKWGSLTLSVEANSLVPYFTQLGALRQHGLPHLPIPRARPSACRSDFKNKIPHHFKKLPWTQNLTLSYTVHSHLAFLRDSYIAFHQGQEGRRVSCFTLQAQPHS